MQPWTEEPQLTDEDEAGGAGVTAGHAPTAYLVPGSPPTPAEGGGAKTTYAKCGPQQGQSERVIRTAWQEKAELLRRETNADGNLVPGSPPSPAEGGGAMNTYKKCGPRPVHRLLHGPIRRNSGPLGAKTVRRGVIRVAKRATRILRHSTSIRKRQDTVGFIEVGDLAARLRENRDDLIEILSTDAGHFQFRLDPDGGICVRCARLSHLPIVTEGEVPPWIQSESSEESFWEPDHGFVSPDSSSRGVPPSLPAGENTLAVPWDQGLEAAIDASPRAAEATGEGPPIRSYTIPEGRNTAHENPILEIYRSTNFNAVQMALDKVRGDNWCADGTCLTTTVMAIVLAETEHEKYDLSTGGWAIITHAFMRKLTCTRRQHVHRAIVDAYNLLEVMFSEIEEDCNADPENTELYIRWQVIAGLRALTKIPHDDPTYLHERQELVDAIAPQGSGDLEYVITELQQDYVSIQLNDGRRYKFRSNDIITKDATTAIAIIQKCMRPYIGDRRINIATRRHADGARELWAWAKLRNMPILRCF